MYSIGEFSKIHRVTTKTLRHYDQLGLLKPARIDEATGYRFYSAQQLPILRRILSLREIGFSLSEIATLLSNERQEGELLRRRITELTAVLEEDQRRLALAQRQLARCQGADAMNPNIKIQSLPEVTVAFTRTRVPDYDAFFEVVPKMGDEMRAVGARCREPAYCFTIYLNDEYREHDIDVEICEAVEKPCQETRSLRFKQVAGVPEAACLEHRGPYSTLSDSYSALHSWLEESDYVAADHAREWYIDGIWNKDSPDDWLTIIQLPLKKAS